MRPAEDPLRDAHDVIPERLPLVLLVPDVRALEQRDDKPLRLHEHHLGRADLSLHGNRLPCAPQVFDLTRNLAS